MWRFVEKRVPQASSKPGEWLKKVWQERIKNLTQEEKERMLDRRGGLVWPYKCILQEDPKMWDISVCHTAICESNAIPIDNRKPRRRQMFNTCPQNEKEALDYLTRFRNHLFHRRPLEMFQYEYNKMVTESRYCYSVLLRSGPDLSEFCNELNKATQCERIIVEVVHGCGHVFDKEGCMHAVA